MQDTILDVDSNEEITIDLKKYFALFWQWAWLIILAGIIAGLTAFLVSRQITPVYEATTTVLVSDSSSTQSSDLNSLRASELLSQTYAQMMTKNPILEETISRLGLTMEVKDLREMISVSPVTNTQLIEVLVESTDPTAAALIANTVVDIFTKEIESVQTKRYDQSKESLQAKLDEVEDEITYYNNLAASTESEVERADYFARATQYRETYYSLLELYENIWLSEAETISSVAVVEPAILPDVPVRPRVLINTALAGVVGVMLAAGGLLAREALDDTLHTPDEVKNHLNLPVLGAIETISQDQENRLIAMNQPRHPITEAFRALRENTRFASIDRDLHTLLVTSASPEEGKSTVTANLALVFAQAGVDTILVDCDFRKPVIHNLFDISNQHGVSTILFNQDTAIDESRWQSPIDHLRVITSGPLPPNPAELIASKRMKAFIEDLKNRADLIIIDTPPVQPVTDAASLAPEMDGMLMIVHPGKTSISAAKQAIEQLKRAKARILGVVLNPLDLHRSQYAYRYAYQNGRNDYRTYYHKTDSDPSKNK